MLAEAQALTDAKENRKALDLLEKILKTMHYPKALSFEVHARAAIAYKGIDDVENCRLHIDSARKANLSVFKENMLARTLEALEKELEITVDTWDAEKAESLKEELIQNPEDNEKHYELAAMYAKHGEHKKAINECLDIIWREKHWENDKALELIVGVIGELGKDSKLVVDTKRELSRILYS